MINKQSNQTSSLVLDDQSVSQKVFRDHKYSVVVSDDYFKAEKVVKAGGSRFAVTNHYIFVASTSNHSTAEIQLQVSDLLVKDYQLETVKLPFNMLKEHSYTVLESQEARVFMHVTHSVAGLNYGHVYVSDSRGRRFDLSLQFNVKNQFGYCDFDRVDGLPNFYIANHYEEDSLRLARFQLE